jgi:flagellar biosynthesis protein FliQ
VAVLRVAAGLLWVCCWVVLAVSMVAATTDID